LIVERVGNRVGGRLSAAVVVTMLVAVTLVVVGAPAGANLVIDGCVIVPNPTPTVHTVCPGADLAGANLIGVDFSYADLEHADLSGATANDETWLAIDATGINLTGAVFTNVRMTGSLAGAVMHGMTFTETQSLGAAIGGSGVTDLSGADLTDADLNAFIIEANLTNADFTGAQLQVEWSDNTLTGSIWTGSSVLPANQVVETTLTYGTHVTWPAPSGDLPFGCTAASGLIFETGTTLVSCTVNDPQTLTHGSGTFTVTVEVVPSLTVGGCAIVNSPTPVNHTTCANASLANAQLAGLDLSYADLHGANLEGANLIGTKLEQADLHGAHLDWASATTADFRGASLAGASATEATFNDADLTGADLTSFTLVPTAIGDTNFTHTILGITDRTYPATAANGAVLGWKKPAAYAALPGWTVNACSPAAGSLFPVGTTTVTCRVFNGQRFSPTGFFTFTETVQPVVEPGAGEVNAPSSGTSDLPVTVALNAAAPYTITVPWTTLHVGGTPTIYGAPQAPISDYTPSNGTVTFLAGQTSAVVHIPVNADTAGGSGPEFVVVSFHDPTSSFMGGFYGLGFGIIDPTP
jgi:uncharacterized protein YjbI with pentapeptide repeats